MSSFDRRIFLTGLLALAGCGFTPVYGPGGSAEGLRGKIDVIPPDDPEGFALVRRLETRLGLGETAEYRLEGNIGIAENAAGILPDGTISRYNVIGSVDWRLVRLSNEAVALSGREASFTSYSATSTTVATIVAQRDARERLMISIADRITADILARSDAL